MYAGNKLLTGAADVAAVDLAGLVLAAGGGGGTNAGRGMATGVNSLQLSAVCCMRSYQRSRLQKPSNCADGMLACRSEGRVQEE